MKTIEKPKNEKRNKWLLFFAFIVFFIIAFATTSCKKKTVDPTPPPTCQTGLVKFSGSYYLTTNTNQLITIDFVNNNCPTENSNTYLVKGLSTILQLYVKAGQTIQTQDYSVVSDEVNSNTTTTTLFTITIRIIQQSPLIIGVSSSKTTKELTFMHY